jgi:hypothetical protein
MPDALDRQIQDTVAAGRGYTLVLLWKGPVRDQSEAEADRLQRAHLRHLFTLRNEGSLLLNGPVLDDGELVGIGIFAGQDRDVSAPSPRRTRRWRRDVCGWTCAPCSASPATRSELGDGPGWFQPGGSKTITGMTRSVFRW